jgi:hypothetical protein
MVGRVSALLLVVAIVLTILPGLYVPSSLVVGEQVRLVRSPAEVCSGQPVLVFAYAPSGRSVELEVSVYIEAGTNVSLPTSPPQPMEKTYKIPMVPVPWALGWYVSHIPGLPSKSWVFDVRLLSRTITVKFTVASKVVYKLIVDGGVVATDSYVVKESEITKQLPPLVYAFVYDVLNDTSIINETLGLGPHGWVLGSGEIMKVMILAFDETSQPEVGFEYRVGEGSWITASAEDSVLMNELNSLAEGVNDFIGIAENWVKSYKSDLTIPRSRLTIKLAEASIPAQNAGTYVMFKATARDVDGNVMTSPIGYYYVINKSSNTRILILDPYVTLWLLEENLKELFNTLKTNTDHGAPDEVAAPLRRAENISKNISDYGLVQFHHWEYLGKYYNIIIAWPGKGVADMIEEFKPNVIILSNLILGAEYGEAWDWDLRDIEVDGKSLLQRLISYVKETHAGVIATHATLSDEIVWLGCEERVKLGARGHVGYGLDDVNIVDEQTVAALLGMPELALWEYVRDEVANALCNASKASETTQPQLAALLKATASAIGSIPLQVPHVPWDGSLKLTPEAEELGWDIPSEFAVEMPTLAGKYGFKAYTEVGWQLAIPRVVAYRAWDEVFKARGNVSKLVSRVTSLYENITNGYVKSPELNTYFSRAVERELKNFYRGLNGASIRGLKLNVSIPIPELNEAFNITVNMSMKTLINLLQKLPVKIAALSPDGLAGIIVHDKFWDSGGYRSVYFSFEVEASRGEITEKLLTNAVEWVKKWQYKNITELLGNLVRVPKETATKFKETVAKAPGNEVLTDGMILNEEGSSETELNAAPGKLHLVIAHPTTDIVSVEVMRGSARIINITKVDEHVTQVVIIVDKAGTITISLRAGSDAALNSAYVTIKYEAVPTTTTSPTTTLTTTLTTPTSTTTPATTPTTTPATTSQTATLTSPVPADNTLLYAGIVTAIIISGVLVFIMIRKK